jgi:hypothetical protein
MMTESPPNPRQRVLRAITAAISKASPASTPQLPSTDASARGKNAVNSVPVTIAPTGEYRKRRAVLARPTTSRQMTWRAA